MLFPCTSHCIVAKYWVSYLSPSQTNTSESESGILYTEAQLKAKEDGSIPENGWNGRKQIVNEC